MSVLVNLTAFSRITIHNLIKLSPNSASSGILFTASDTIFDANADRKTGREARRVACAT